MKKQNKPCQRPHTFVRAAADLQSHSTLARQPGGQTRRGGVPRPDLHPVESCCDHALRPTCPCRPLADLDRLAGVCPAALSGFPEPVATAFHPLMGHLPQHYVGQIDLVELLRSFGIAGGRKRIRSAPEQASFPDFEPVAVGWHAVQHRENQPSSEKLLTTVKSQPSFYWESTPKTGRIHALWDTTYLRFEISNPFPPGGRPQGLLAHCCG